MNKIEYEHLKNSDMGNNKIIDSECLVDKKDRTLLYGYTCNGKTWHVYIKDEQIHIVVYDFEWDDKLKKYTHSQLREVIPFSNYDFNPIRNLIVLIHYLFAPKLIIRIIFNVKHL